MAYDDKACFGRGGGVVWGWDGPGGGGWGVNRACNCVFGLSSFPTFLSFLTCVFYSNGST